MLIGKQISGLFLSFSSNRVCDCCGMRHNAETDLYGTDFRCAIRLQLSENYYQRHNMQCYSILIIYMRFFISDILTRTAEVIIIIPVMMTDVLPKTS